MIKRAVFVLLYLQCSLSGPISTMAFLVPSALFIQRAMCSSKETCTSMQAAPTVQYGGIAHAGLLVSDTEKSKVP